jgi:hypothetical protein
MKSNEQNLVSRQVRKNFDILLEVAPYTPTSPVPGEIGDKT